MGWIRKKSEPPKKEDDKQKKPPPPSQAQDDDLASDGGFPRTRNHRIAGVLIPGEKNIIGIHEVELTLLDHRFVFGGCLVQFKL